MKQKKSPASTGPTNTRNTDTLIITDFSEIAKHLIPLFGKIPRLKKGDTWKRSFDDEEFPEGCNYGLRLGEETEWGYLTVIDYDGSEHFLEFLSMLREKGIDTDTVAVKTGGKHQGYHLYFWTDKSFTGRFKGQFEGIDVEILGEGCYTVIPPSKVANDYRIVEAFTEKEPITFRVSSVESFLDELERAAEISFSKLQIIQESFKEESAPSNYNSSYLVHFSHISGDLLLWELILNDSYKSIYDEELHLFKSLGFKCVFHKEENPSANLFWIDEKAKFVYHDFHDGKNYDIVEVFHALKNHREPEFLPAVDSRKWTDGLLELFDWIDENSITTGFGERFDCWRSDFLERLILTGGGEFKNYIVDTLKVILEISRERINKGINELVLSKRYVADRVPWEGSDKTKAFIVNRAMNFLVFAGFLKKGRDLATENGRTYIFSINFECKVTDVEKAWSELVKVGLSNYRDFNKANVADVFGEKVASDIFRASAIEREVLSDGKRLSNDSEGQLRDGPNRNGRPIYRDKFKHDRKPRNEPEHFKSRGRGMGHRTGSRNFRERLREREL